MPRHFDLLAPLYDRLVHLFLGTPDPDRWREILALPARGWLLDAGGGTGRVGESIRPLVGHLAVADASRPMLRQSLRKRGLTPVQADAARLPFKSGGFARVLVVDAWHHFSEPELVLGELLRVLEPGGRLVIEEFDGDRLPVKILAAFERLLLMGSRFTSPALLQAALAKHHLPTRVVHGGRFTVWIIADHPLAKNASPQD